MKKFILTFLICVCVFNFSVDAKSYVVYDLDSGRILDEYNANKSSLIASITKVMTCIIVLENGNLNDIVTVGDEVLSMYGTNIYLEVGEKISVKDLLYGLMLRSGNDASVVLAKYVSQTEENFVKEMNLYASKLGMKNTKFSNCHGLDDNTKNYSSSYDMYLLSKYAFNNKIYRDIIKTYKYKCKSNLKSYIWYNRVSILKDYKYSLGGKNGYTPSAGKTLISYASKADINLGIISINDSDIYNNQIELFEDTFNKYSKYKIIDKNSFFIGNEFFILDDFYYVLSESELDRVYTIVNLYKDLDNSTGGVIGNITIMLDDKEIGNINIYNKKKKQLSFFEKIKLFIRNSIKTNSRSTE